MKTALIFGTSRAHRPFSRRVNGFIESNINPGVKLIYPRIGYFHTVAEILQAIKFLLNPNCIPGELWKYVFRIEPKMTTPNNEFDISLVNAIKSHNYAYVPFVDIKQVQIIVMEISSLTVNRHIPTGCYMHTNPNFELNIPYGNIYPDGHYKKYLPDFPVVKSETTLHEMIEQIKEIKKMLPKVKLITFSHLQSNHYPNKLRAKVDGIVKISSAENNCDYIDIGPLLDEYGFAQVNDLVDVHHLSMNGEDAFSKIIYNHILY